uniref:Pre-mRNA-processing factor 39 n=1 Tax=Laticauda laticaudata TaxID=8630 RepID=A0A8C5SX44_LATLA
ASTQNLQNCKAYKLEIWHICSSLVPSISLISPLLPFQGALDPEKLIEQSISIRQQIFSHNEAEVSKRWNFEDGIKRPYFHVKPLERAQLRNWRDYLDFEIVSGSHERTIVLFERCVIACALYEEFWIKYIRYLENHSIAGARSVFQRACCYHLPRKPNIHLLWAAFEEKQGEVEEARRILKTFEDYVPGLVMVRLRRVSLERRLGNMDMAEALLMEAIRDNEGMPISSFYSVKLARQVLKVQKNLAKARKILLEALEKDPDNAKLYANLLEMEFSADVRQNEGNTMSSFDRALTSGLPLETKIIFSQRRVEFLEDFGSSINSLLMCYEEHQKLLNQQMMRKRLLENG